MNKKILLLGLVVLGIVMCTSLVSAYTSYAYASQPYERLSCVNCGMTQPSPIISTYYPRYTPSMPVRVGGFFGSSSAYITGLRPGTYYQTTCVQRPSMFYQPCDYGYGYGYTRTGGYFGNYYGLRGGTGGTFTFSGMGTNYAKVPYMYHGPL